MKNKLVDLNNHLFMQLERLGDEDLTPEQIESEVKRTEAIVKVSTQIVQNAALAVKAAELIADHGAATVGRYLPMIDARPIEGKAE